MEVSVLIHSFINLRFVTRTRRNALALKDSSGVWDVYLKWHEYQLEKHDKDDFTGIEIQGGEWSSGQRNTPIQLNVPLTASEPDVFKNFTDLECESIKVNTTYGQRQVRAWPLRLSNKINNKLKVLDSEKQLKMLEPIFALQLGLISDAQILETGPIMYLAGFSKLIKGNQSIVFAIVPERIPVVQTVLNKTHIVGFKFR